MNYQETLEWMFAQLPMYQRLGQAAYNAKLEPIQEFSSLLGNPENKFRSIHVAGTNGKGSSSHMLSSVLQEAGYNVGLYTSPHLKDFRERIKINGKPISKKEVVSFIRRYRPFLEAHSLSFFEMSVGLAFKHFANREVDIAVIEVGLGGRLDSTNIILPEVALITNIGLDHTELLGDTLPKITVEKAGIIKPGVPVVISEWQEETAPVFSALARERKAEIYFAEKEITEVYPTDLKGRYQEKNIKGVLQVLLLLKNINIEEAHIKAGLRKVVKNTGLLGRWQILRQKPKVICDTAHNKEGLTLALAQLQQETFWQLHIVLGFVKDKDLDLILPLFPKKAFYYFCMPAIPRGQNAHYLREKAKAYGLEGEVYGSVADALRDALKAADSRDVIFVGGSTFVVAEVV